MVGIMKALIFAFFLVYAVHLTAADIAVVTIAAGDGYKKKVELGIENKRIYCQQHGYDFIFCDESQDPSRHIYWSKILSVLRALENPSYKWIVWIDADTLVMNQGIPLEDFIDEKYNFIISKDLNGINAGIFFIKNCEWARSFLESVYARIDCISACWPEQQAIALQLENPSFSSLAKVVPQRLFNSYAEELYQGLTVSYQPGDFILHFASGIGVPNNGLSSLFQKYVQKVVNNRELLTLDQYLGIYGFKLSPLDSRNNEGYMSNAQRLQFRERLKGYPDIEKIAEIGLNGGHSAANFFQSCKRLKKFVSFDVNYHAYTQVAIEYFSSRYKDIFEFVQGDSLLKVPEYAKCFPDQKFDLIYIDGYHSYDYCLNDIVNCKQLSHPGTVVWVDDYNASFIQAAVATAQRMGFIEIVNVHRCQDQHGERCWVEVRYTSN
jgi:predicted O-methyltransferase YrrM